MLMAVVLAAGVAFRTPFVVPPVEKLASRTDVEVRLDASQRIVVRSPDAQAREWVSRHVRDWFGVESKVVSEPGGADLADEAYRLSARADGLVVEAKTLQGVRYALYSLRQITERDSAGAVVTAYRMPEFTIEDKPALKFRGIHFCWFPEQSVTFIEREIRLAAYAKFNVVVLESWGVFRSEKHPWFGWPDGPMTKPAIRRLVEVARDLGVTLVPQVNVFGHASASRSCVGKHAALDFAPERQSLFEPAGGGNGSMSSAWNWCLTNPAAVETVRDLVVELHEAFGNPPYFHIGCDEADGPSCASCRAVPYSELASRHITAISELLKARGARAMMWHDMLLKKGDVRWKGFYANGSDETAKLADLLPRDVIVCDWYYGNDPGGGKSPKDKKSIVGRYPTLDYFAKECGFDTLTCPWEEPGGIVAQTRYARERGLFGVLATTWHHMGGDRFSRMVQLAACGAWGHGEAAPTGHFVMMWRQCGWDMKTRSYGDSGFYDTQISRDIQGR